MEATSLPTAPAQIVGGSRRSIISVSSGFRRIPGPSGSLNGSASDYNNIIAITGYGIMSENEARFAKKGFISNRVATVDFRDPGFETYKSCVYNKSCGTNITHAVIGLGDAIFMI